MFFVAARIVSADEDVDVREQRLRARWPTPSWAALRDGSFTRGIDAYVADRFPGRDGFLDWAQAMRGALGIAADGEVFWSLEVDDFGLSEEPSSSAFAGVDDAGIANVPRTPPVAGVLDNAKPWDPAGSAADAGIVDGEDREDVDVDAGTVSLLEIDAGPAQESWSASASAPSMTRKRSYRSGVEVSGERGLMYLVGDDDTARAFAAAVNAWARALPQDVRLDVLVTPTATHYYLPEDKTERSLPQRENLMVLRSTLVASVNFVDVEAALAAHVDEEIFYRTDHHWTGLGAFYAYEAWARQAGLVPVDKDTLERRRRPPSLGSLYRTTQSQVLARHPDATEYWVPTTPHQALRWRSLDEPPAPMSLLAERERSYAVFLGGDDPLVVVNTQQHTARRVILVKNSYGNAFAPWLLPHFDVVVIVDYRYFGGSALDLVQKYDATDVIVLNATVTANSKAHARRLQEVLTGRGTAWTFQRLPASAPSSAAPTSPPVSSSPE